MEANERVVVYNDEYSVCTGCRSCEILCSVMHDGVYSPERSRIGFEVGNLKDMMHNIYTCQQCEDRPCYEACPKKDVAMCVDDRGIVYVDRDECIGCRKCVKACTFDPPRIHVVKRGKKRWAVKCDLCRDIEGGPVCIRTCPTMKLGLVADSSPSLLAPKGWVITEQGAMREEEAAEKGLPERIPDPWTTYAKGQAPAGGCPASAAAERIVKEAERVVAAASAQPPEGDRRDAALRDVPVAERRLAGVATQGKN